MSENFGETIHDVTEAFRSARELFAFYQHRFHGAWPCQAVLVKFGTNEWLSENSVNGIVTISVSPTQMTMNLDPADDDNQFFIKKEVTEPTRADIGILNPEDGSILHHMMQEIGLRVRAGDTVKVLAHVPSL